MVENYVGHPWTWMRPDPIVICPAFKKQLYITRKVTLTKKIIETEEISIAR